MAQNPPVEVEESEEETTEEESQDEESANPETIEDEANPLNPAGDNLDRLIQIRMNDDLWSAMLGELPCLAATESCVKELQELAISNSLALRAIDERVELINEKINEARRNNQRTINLGVFEPAVQYFLNVEQLPGQNGQPPRRRGFFDRIADLLGGNTLGVINDVFSLIGIPLFRNIAGGDQAAQQRTIAIADLQVKVAEIENKRGEIASQIREQVILNVLRFDELRREFQISQEVARRSQLRLQIMAHQYRFAVGSMDTPAYLREINALDQQKGATFRAWSQLRAQLTRVKLLVLGAE